MKMVPGFFHGGGAFARQAAFQIEDYCIRYTELGWLVGKWHNALYHILEPALRVEEAAK